MHETSLLAISTLAFGAAGWDDVRAGLPDGIDVLAVSLPGHGEPASLAAWDVDDAPELVSWLEDRPRPPHVVGAGAGALVAERVARAVPIASLTVFGWPPDQTPGEMGKRVVATREALDGADEDEFFATYRAGAAPRAETEPVRAPVTGEAFLAGLEVAAAWVPRPLPTSLPVTLVRGAEDQRCRPVDVQALAALWAAELIEVPGAGHATYVDAPHDVARLLVDVISTADRSLR